MLRRLDKTYSAFFSRIKADKTPGFQRVKGYDRFKIVQYRYGNGYVLCYRENEQVRFYTQNVGVAKVIFHLYIPDDANIKHVVVKRVNEKWYDSLMLEIPDQQIALHQECDTAGIDMGLKSLILRCRTGNIHATTDLQSGRDLWSTGSCESSIYTSKICSECREIVEKTCLYDHKNIRFVDSFSIGM